jgi:hypothetical protein
LNISRPELCLAKAGLNDDSVASLLSCLAVQHQDNPQDDAYFKIIDFRGNMLYGCGDLIAAVLKKNQRIEKIYLGGNSSQR